MIHIRIDDKPYNGERQFACGIGPDLPEGDMYVFAEGSHCSDCPGCKPGRTSRAVLDEANGKDIIDNDT